jgi:thiol-disulfide isomerase/thioredoxin
MKTLSWKRNGLLLLGMMALGTGTVTLPTTEIRLITTASAQEGDARQMLLASLFKPDATDEEYAAALQQAKEAGFPAQLLLEAQIARSLFTRDHQALASLKQPLVDAGANLNIEMSRLFHNRQAYDSMVQGLSALEANQKGDEAAFEKHIKEALWLAPEPMQELYLQWLNSTRKEARMKKIVVPLDQQILTAEGGQTTLTQLLGGNKALLLDFWASWCAPCIVAMDGINEKSTKLAGQGVVMVGINTEGDAAIASDIKKQKQVKLPWLLEEIGGAYTTLFETDAIPQYVLVSSEGKVLFNGHPEDPALKSALKKIGVTL